MGKRTHREPKVDKLGAGTSEAIRPFDGPFARLDKFVLKGGDPPAVGYLSHDTGEIPMSSMRELEEISYIGDLRTSGHGPRTHAGRGGGFVGGC